LIQQHIFLQRTANRTGNYCIYQETRTLHNVTTPKQLGFRVLSCWLLCETPGFKAPPIVTQFTLRKAILSRLDTRLMSRRKNRLPLFLPCGIAIKEQSIL
jgi:hypothetical protein